MSVDPNQIINQNPVMAAGANDQDENILTTAEENSILRAAAQRRTVFKSAILETRANLEGVRLKTLNVTQIEERIRKLDNTWSKYQMEHLTIIAESTIQAALLLHGAEYDELDSE